MKIVEIIHSEYKINAAYLSDFNVDERNERFETLMKNPKLRILWLK